MTETDIWQKPHTWKIFLARRPGRLLAGLEEVTRSGTEPGAWTRRVAQSPRGTAVVVRSFRLGDRRCLGRSHKGVEGPREETHVAL